MNTAEYLGIPYRKNGRGWDGADCYGFARLIMEKETGFIMPPLDGKTAASDEDFSLYEKIERPEELSLVFLQGGPFGDAHIAVYTEEALLHMSENGPCCQDWRRLRRYIRAIYRPRNR